MKKIKPQKDIVLDYRVFKAIVGIAGLFAVYFFTARLGLQIGAVHVFATLIWPPSGIALAALLLFGRNLWPGIALGAWLVNWVMGAPALVALGIATGNTLEALLAAWLLTQLDFKPSLSRTRDVFYLVILASFLSTAFSAIIGVGSLLAGGIISHEAIYPTWLAWWFGDMLGDLLVAPVLLVWSRGPWRAPAAHLLEVGLLLSLALLGTFSVLDVFSSSLLTEPYLIFPLLIVLAMRLNQRWTVSAIVLIASAVIVITTLQQGYFWTGSLSESLLKAQIFLAVLSVTSMVLAATVMERKAREAEAREATRLRDEFLSIASHELKTPMTALTLQLQLFNRNVPAGDVATQTATIPRSTLHLVSMAADQAKKLAALIDELLDLARIRSGRIKLERSQVNLCELVNETIQRFRAGAGESTSSIDVRYTTSVFGNWDRLRLEQVVTNLISNAIKYGDGKPVAVTIEQGPLSVRMIVQDRGIGIAPEMQKKIFERFERGNIRGEVSGLGLGLYICRQIVEAHGGTIEVESVPGEGTTFSVDLPHGGST